MGVNRGMMTSATDLWATPQWLFDELNREFGFTLDTCALPENAKCEKYYTPEVDGLAQEWLGVVYCNPPYGKEVGAWTEKAAHEVSVGNADVVVMLLPASTDTKWFHKLWENKNVEVRFLKGRLKFNDGKGSAPFPSMVCVFAKGRENG